LHTDDRRLGLAILSKQNIHLRGRNTFAVGDVEWEQQKSVELDKLLSPKPSLNKLGQWLAGILGYDEDINVILVATTIGAFMMQLETVQFRKKFQRPLGHHLLSLHKSLHCHSASNAHLYILTKSNFFVHMLSEIILSMSCCNLCVHFYCIRPK
jgi:hypothetical protein